MLCIRLVLIAGLFLVSAVTAKGQSQFQQSIPLSCNMVTSNTVDFMCPGNTTCPAKVPTMTTVHTTCKAGHIPTEYLQNMVCRGESWSYIPICKPDCGLLNPSADAKTLPWNVGIYLENVDGAINQICGGTLIHSNVVIGAAHCFFNQTSQQASSPEHYRVVIGKTVRTWNHEEALNNSDIQISEVSKIVLHELYLGEGNLQADLAILVLKTPFLLSDSVRPACYDLTDGDFNRDQMTPGNFGKVIGWGRTETDYDSVAVRMISIPVVDLAGCRKEMTKYGMLSYITLDKFCAGTLGENGLCNGDGGSGLVIQLKESARYDPRYYLRGVVSLGVRSPEGGRCRDNTYTLFTNLFSLRDWLVVNLRRLI